MLRLALQMMDRTPAADGGSVARFCRLLYCAADESSLPDARAQMGSFVRILRAPFPGVGASRLVQWMLCIRGLIVVMVHVRNRCASRQLLRRGDWILPMRLALQMRDRAPAAADGGSVADFCGPQVSAVESSFPNAGTQTLLQGASSLHSFPGKSVCSSPKTRLCFSNGQCGMIL